MGRIQQPRVSGLGRVAGRAGASPLGPLYEPARHGLTIVAAIFDSIFVPEAVQETVSDGAWVQAMLEAEAALAAAQAAEGDLGRGGRGGGGVRGEFDDLGGAEAANPVVPLAARCASGAGGAPRRDEPGHPRHRGDARLRGAR